MESAELEGRISAVITMMSLLISSHPHREQFADPIAAISDAISQHMTEADGRQAFQVVMERFARAARE